MKKTFSNIQLIIILFFLIATAQAQQNGKLRMWYNKPARVWNEALPIGNGRIAAMVFGDPVTEKLQLNESSFWSGGPSRNDNLGSLAVLDSVRQSIFKEDYKRAETLANRGMTAQQLHGARFQTIGNLNLKFDGHENFSKYYRELDLEKAIFTTSYEVDGVTYKREVFSSQPDQVIVFKLTASARGKLSFSVGFDSPLQKSVNPLDDKTLEMTGLSGSNAGVVGQVKSDTRARIINSGGSTAIESNSIKVSNADEVLILVSIATNFVDYKTLTANEADKCSSYIAKAEKKSYSTLKESHIAAFQKYFNRVHFDLGNSTESKLPIDERIKNIGIGV